MRKSAMTMLGLMTVAGTMGLLPKQAAAAEGFDMCVKRFVENHVPAGTPVRIEGQSADAFTDQLRSNQRIRVTAEAFGMPGHQPIGSVTCVLDARGNLRFMYASVDRSWKSDQQQPDVRLAKR